MTRIFGVIGKPVLHSKSPAVFKPVLNRSEYYLRFAADSCEEIISLKSKLPIAGINITSPFKNHSYNISESRSESSEQTKAVNTLTFNSQITGYNTDVDGVIGALKGTQVEGKKVLVLGAGGAARAACYAIKQLGGELFVWNRTNTKAEELAIKYNGKVFENSNNFKFDLIVSTVPSEEPLFNNSIINSSTTILDAVYGKVTWISNLAREINCKLISGETWLLKQANSAASIFLEREVKLGEIIFDYKKLNPKRIFLIGMMGSGKSTCGEILAKKQDLPFYDLDKEIEKREGATIPKIFNEKGEAYFREKESQILNELASSEGVFATGGGVIENQNSRELLKSAESINIWLWANDNTAKIRIDNSNRPLVNDLDFLLKRRIPLYAECTDLFLNSESRSPDQCVERISYEICETWPH